MLESKNKVFQKVSKTANKHLHLAPLESTMVDLNQRFQSCVAASKEWEGRLEKGLRLWRNLQSKAQPLEEWVQEAEAVLGQEEENINDLIANHRAFFDTVNLQMVLEFSKAGQELLAVLAEEDCEELENSMQALHDRQKVEEACSFDLMYRINRSPLRFFSAFRICFKWLLSVL